MNKFTKTIQLIAFALVMFIASNVYSQCAATFSWSSAPNGVVNFTCTTAPTPSTAFNTWIFGNNTTTTTPGFMNTASNSYTANGTYTVTLLFNTGSCSLTTTQVITVTNAVTPTCNLNANFTSSGGPSGNRTFNNTSTGTVSGTTYTWNFGDGSANSNVVSPSKTYTANGTYAVILYASNNVVPACTDSLLSVITISNVASNTCTINANFTHTSAGSGVINFNNTSTGTNSTTTYGWSFGDGSAGSSVLSPSHIYTSNGSYQVRLWATNSTTTGICSDTIIKTVTVGNSTCTANASFSMAPTGTAQSWYAIPASTVNLAGAIWSWGDGSSSTGLFSSHTYSASGNYVICLSVTLTCGDTASFCNNYNIFKSSEDQSIIQVNVKTIEQIIAGVNEIENSPLQLNLKPNPNNGKFSVNIDNTLQGTSKLSVVDVMGKLVYSTELENNQPKEIDLNAVEQGVYFINISNNNKAKTHKLIITK